MSTAKQVYNKQAMDAVSDAIIAAAMDIVKVGREHPELTIEQIEAQLREQFMAQFEAQLDDMTANLDKALNAVVEVVAQCLEVHDVLSGAKAANIAREIGTITRAKD